jgi:hypothetical protein
MAVGFVRITSGVMREGPVLLRVGSVANGYYEKKEGFVLLTAKQEPGGG